MSVLNVIGVQKSQGSVDGNDYNFSKIFAVASLGQSDVKSGFAGIEIRGIPAISDKYLGFAFKPEGIPFEVQIEAIAIGKGEFRDTVTAMVPVSELPKNDALASKMAGKAAA